MFTVSFLKDAAERAIKTFAQALLSLLTVGNVVSTVDWGTASVISGTAAVISILTSIASSGVPPKGSASLIK